MLDSFLSEYVMPVDQLARSSTEQVRLRSAGSDAIAQLLHLASHRLFAQRRFDEVRPSFDVPVPLEPTFFVVISAFIIGKAADIWRSRSTSTRPAAVPSGMHSRLFYGQWMRPSPIAAMTARPLVA